MAGNSQRRGARQRGKGIGAQGRTAGSGGRPRKALEGKGPTPKAEDRVYHKAYRGKQASARRDLAGTGGRSAGLRSGPRTPKLGADWVVGRNPVWEALRAGVPVKVAYVAEGAERDDRLRDIFRFAADHAQPLLQITRAELDRLTGGAVHQGVALQVPPFAYADPQEVVDLALDQFDLAARAADDEAPLGPVIVACDHITDPHNLGAIIRSAAAFGAVGILLPQRRSAHVTAAVWKASAGAAAHLPVAQVTNLNQALVACAKAGFTVIGLAGDGDAVIAEAPTDEPIVLVVGAEDTGLSRLVREHCDVVARIPMSDTIESLNASVAVGVALYELRRF